MDKMTMEIFTKLEQQWLMNNAATLDSGKKVRVLSIDGGGTTAAVAAAFLVYLEDQIQLRSGDPTARISDHFDLIAATGVSSILAAMIAAVNPHSGRPMFSARDAYAFITQNHHLLFKPKRSKYSILSPFKNGGSRRSKFSDDSLNKSLAKLFGKLTLKDMCKPVLVPCYDLTTSAPFVFSRAAASASEWGSQDFELWKVCRAAVTAPGVLKPFSLSSVDGKTAFTAVDGCAVMNNPAAAAVTHALHNKGDFPAVQGVEDLMVLSLGNGSLCGGNSVRVGVSVSDVADIAADGVSETVDQMLGNAFSWNRCDYVRIQANGLAGPKPMTMAEALKERSIESLPFGGKRLLPETNGERIENFVQRVIAPLSKNSLPPSPYKSLSPVLDGR